MDVQLVWLALLVFSCTVSTSCAQSTEDQRYEELLRVVEAMVQNFRSLDSTVNTALRKQNMDHERMEQTLNAIQAKVLALATDGEGSEEQNNLVGDAVSVMSSRLQEDIDRVHNESLGITTRLETIELRLESGFDSLYNRSLQLDERLDSTAESTQAVYNQTAPNLRCLPIESQELISRLTKGYIDLTSSLSVLKVMMQDATETTKDEIRDAIAQITGVCKEITVSGYRYGSSRNGVYLLNGDWCVSDGYGGGRPVYKQRDSVGINYLVYDNVAKVWSNRNRARTGFRGRFDVKSPELDTWGGGATVSCTG